VEEGHAMATFFLVGPSSVDAIIDREQGDEIGQIFTHWSIVYFLICSFRSRNCANLWATFSTVKIMYLFFIKFGFGYTLADFLQTHLVTLVEYGEADVLKGSDMVT
jgi:hypothetical protein